MARRATPAKAAALRTGGLALATDVARRFHLDGASKVQIAQDLGLNRFKVARLLDLAAAAGLVQIVVGTPPELDAALAEQLRARYALQHAVVIADTPGEPLMQRVRVGRVAAELLEQLITDEDVVGLAWGRVMSAVADSWNERVAATFVQLAGSLVRPDVAQNGPELVAGFARTAGGSAVTFYAPLVLADDATAASLRGDPAVAQALSTMDRLTKAVLSVGSWSTGGSTVHDALGARDRERLQRLGVCAEVSGLLFDADGRVVDALSPRTLSVTEQQLRDTDQVLALAAGEDRAPAVRAVLRSGLLTGLVTHASLARRVLAAA